MHDTSARLVERVLEGQGWFLGFHTFTHYVKVASSPLGRSCKARMDEVPHRPWTLRKHMGSGAS